MKIQVHLFARAKDLIGASLVQLELPEGATVGDLRRGLAERYPNLRSLLQRSALAVQDEFAQDTWRLPAEAEIALLPPVSGG